MRYVIDSLFGDEIYKCNEYFKKPLINHSHDHNKISEFQVPSQRTKMTEAVEKIKLVSIIYHAVPLTFKIIIVDKSP